MKKLVLSIPRFLLLLAIIICYSEFKTKNFVDAFIASPDQLEEVVDGITIWEDGESVAIIKPEDEQYDEVLDTLREWEVKRALFKDMDVNNKLYQLDIYNDAKPMDAFNLLITKDGMINIHGQEYELVSGGSIEELIEVAK